jgi:hypothetical protein
MRWDAEMDRAPRDPFRRLPGQSNGANDTGGLPYSASGLIGGLRYGTSGYEYSP